MTNQIITQILIYLTDFSKFVQKITGGIDTSGLRYDWLIIFFFIFVTFIVALSLGRSRMLLAILGLYAAVFLESHFIYFDKVLEFLKGKPYFAEFPEHNPEFYLRVGLFLIFYIIVFGILNNSVLKHRFTLAEGSVFTVTMIAILEMGFLATILISYFPVELLSKVPSRLIPYFATKNAQFWWAVAPLAAMLISRRTKESSS